MQESSTYSYQRQKTPQQELFWSNYINKDLESFGNAYRSAIVSGYTDQSARNITRKEWYKNGEQFYSELLAKAEEVLLADLKMNIWEEIIYRGKGTGEYKINVKLARIRSETSRFVCLTVGKRTYNTKQTKTIPKPRLM